MRRRRLIPVRDPADVPRDMTEEQAREFWDTHALTEEYFQKVEPVAEADLPPLDGFADVRFWLPEDTFRRLKAVARKRHTSYRTLLVEFVTERLKDAEKRAGLVDVQESRSGT